MRSLFALLLLAACGGGEPMGVRSDASSPPADLGVSPDRASGPDLAQQPDLGVGPDATAMSDLALPVDRASAPDLVSRPDLSPDLTAYFACLGQPCMPGPCTWDVKPTLGCFQGKFCSPIGQACASNTHCCEGTWGVSCISNRCKGAPGHSCSVDSDCYMAGSLCIGSKPASPGICCVPRGVESNSMSPGSCCPGTTYDRATRKCL